MVVELTIEEFDSIRALQGIDPTFGRVSSKYEEINVVSAIRAFMHMREGIGLADEAFSWLKEFIGLTKE